MCVGIGWGAGGKASQPAAAVQLFEVVLPQVAHLVGVLGGCEVGDGQGVVAREVALLHAQLDVGRVVLLVFPSESQVVVPHLVGDVGLAYLVVAPQLAPREGQRVARLLHVVGHPSCQPLCGGDEVPDDVLGVGGQLVLNMYALFFHVVVGINRFL